MFASKSKTLLAASTARSRRLPSTATIRSLSTASPEVDIKIVEVGPRDGLQNESTPISIDDKVELIHGLARAGCQTIEAGAFVSPKWVPQMADSLKVFQNLSFDTQQQRPHLSCLVPNLKGLEQAVSLLQDETAVVDEVAIFGAASEEFSQRNIACSIDESLERFRAVVDQARTHNLPVRGYVSTVVGCPYQGDIPPAQVAKVVEQMLELGCYEISLGDTIGVGTPGSIQKMLDEVLTVANPKQLAMHCHDTYGQALANILIGLTYGINTIDSSVAGLGGCPYANGASGNVATEDVVYMLHGMGLSTGINLEELVLVGERVCDILGRTSQSKVAKAILAKRET